MENENNKARVARTYNVDKMTTFSSDDQKPLFYAYNYKNGGFIIISADKRTIPVLAFSGSGYTDWDRSNEINGLKIWIENTKTEINDIKRDNLSADKLITREWDKYLNYSSHSNERTENDPPIGGCDNCQDYTNTINSLFSDSVYSDPWYMWGQDYLSSYLMQQSNCTCGHDPAGCGVVAFAQVARYLNLGSWSYGEMPHFSDINCSPQSSGEWDLSLLMNYCYSILYTINHFGGCQTFTDPWSIPDGFETMGLSNGGSVSTSGVYSKAHTEIAQNKPVIFFASDAITNWHIWVCDGYEYRNISDCIDGQCYSWGYEYLYCNWGWDGYYNGWFSSGDFTPGTHDYTNNIHIIYGFRL